MNCREFRARLLEADPRAIAAALSGPADPAARRLDIQWPGVVPDHVRTCASCREAAERILAAHEDLVAGLEELGPARPLQEATAAAIRESARRRSRVSRASWAVAAAAAIGVLALRALDVGNGVVTDTVEVVASHAGSPAMPEVEALLGESVLVLETDNENVVVFWFYQGRAE